MMGASCTARACTLLAPVTRRSSGPAHPVEADQVATALRALTMQLMLLCGACIQVAGVGPSLASYFGVFHRLMATRLKEAVGASPERLKRIAAELKVLLWAAP